MQNPLDHPNDSATPCDRHFLGKRYQEGWELRKIANRLADQAPIPSRQEAELVQMIGEALFDSGLDVPDEAAVRAGFYSQEFGAFLAEQFPPEPVSYVCGPVKRVW